MKYSHLNPIEPKTSQTVSAVQPIFEEGFCHNFSIIAVKLLMSFIFNHLDLPHKQKGF